MLTAHKPAQKKVVFIPFCVFIDSVRQTISRRTHVRHEEARERATTTESQIHLTH